MPTLIEFITEAQENDGLYPFEVNRHSDRGIKQEIIHFFKYKIKTSNYLVSPIAFSKSKSDKPTPALKRYIERIVVFDSEGNRFFDVYEIFQIDSNKREQKSLEPFVQFFSQIKEYVLEHYDTLHVRFFYEVDPMRLELGVGIGGESDVNDKLDYQDKLNGIIHDSHEFQNWLTFMAGYVKRLGRWSLVGVWNESLLTRKENLDLIEKHYSSD